MTASLLTPLQKDLLARFFAHEKRFVLSGGAALAGFHLGHRRTYDLDLFTASDLLEEGERALSLAAQGMGATVEKIMTAPDIRRRVVRHGHEAIVVDLIRDATPRGPWPIQAFGEVRVDPPQEILANKLCTLLSRSELRDLVDVYALEKAGFQVEDAISLAEQKDAGLTPAQLAWVLSEIDLTGLPEGQIKLHEGSVMPPGMKADAETSGRLPTRHQLLTFLNDLSKRLAAQARPPR